MEIYVVQQGDNIESIANEYGITIERLISDNGLINPYSLVVGQSLVILNPKKIYTVKEGDSLATIADNNGISLMQLIRNNPFLNEREYIYPDETLVIAYNTIRDLEVNGYTTVFISQDNLARALQYLTYISIYNYQIVDNDESIITSFGDDTKIISMAKQYSTIPLLMISAISLTGDLNAEYVYRLLLDTKLQDELISETLQILESKGYMGINFLISYISEYNQNLYIEFLSKMSKALRDVGYYIAITINPDYSAYEDLDYQHISLLVDNIILLQNIWTLKKQPPAPISNISLIRPYIKNVINKLSPKYVSLGKPLFGCDWIIPFVTGSTANIMSLVSTLILAYEHDAKIMFDDESQTPYFEYVRFTSSKVPEQHLVWFIDARSVMALDEIIIEYDLIGTGLWNITCYNQQLFSITNATYNIIKLPIR